MQDLEGKVALVTGGTRGIGLAIARAILERGGSATVTGRSPTADAAALIETFGDSRVVIELGDVSLPEEAERQVQATAARYGRIDMLVHSAGGPAPGRVLDLSTEDWMNAFAMHVHPVFHLFRAAHPHLAREGGAVLLVSSVAGLRGCPGTVAYQTAKGALVPLARALAFDHAAENIRVNVVAPGIIRTRFHDAMTEAARAHNLQNRIPLRREGSVHDVATASLELMCNPFITGEVLTVDGGMSMRITA